MTLCTEASFSAVSGAAVIGFRGPGYAIDATMLELLAEAGYWYDASVVPGYLFPLYKRVTMLKDRIFLGKALRFSFFDEGPPRQLFLK